MLNILHTHRGVAQGQTTGLAFNSDCSHFSMQIINQDYELVPVDALKPHPRNPREGDTVAIAESIIHNGFYGAVVAQKSTGFILAGNHRLKAAVDTGASVVPVIWVDADDEQALRILLADNRTNDLAGYDEAALAEILKGLDSLEGTGYDQAAVDALIEGLGDVVTGDVTDGPESQVGYTSSEVATWRQTLDHFDAMKVGLTATPAAHTTSYFKDIVYRYEYERAVREGYLVDYDVVKVKSNVRMNGIFLQEGEAVDIINPETGGKKMDVLEDERAFESTQVERDKRPCPEIAVRPLSHVRDG